MKILSKFFKTKTDVDKFVQRNPRIRINPFHSLFLTVDNTDYHITNISVTGIGIKNGSKLKQYKVNEEVDGTITLNDEKMKIRFQIIHHGEPTTGVHITHPTVDFERFLRRCFLSEFMGLTLKRVNEELMKEINKGHPFWFYGDDSYELYYIMHEDKILSFHVNYEGFLFQKDKMGFYNIGRLTEDNDGPNVKRSQIVETGEKVPQDYFDHVIRFLEVVPDLDEQHKYALQDEVKKMYQFQWGDYKAK